MNTRDIESLESSIRELRDRDELRDLVSRYSYYFDLNFTPEFVDLFVDDCVVSYGPEVEIHGRDELMVQRSGTSAIRASSHHNANVQLDVSGDNACGIVSLYAWHEFTDGTQSEVWGYYHDTYRRTADGWKFATRRLEVCGPGGPDVIWTMVPRRAGNGIPSCQ